MEVPVINRTSDFDVGIKSVNENEPSLFSRAFSISGDGKLYQAYSFWKWGVLLLIALCASFTTLITRIKSLVLRLRNHVDVSLPSPTLLYDYDSDSDSSCSSKSSDESEDDEDTDDDSVSRWRRVKGDLRVRGSDDDDDDDDKGIIGNIPWIRRCSGSFGDLLSWPDLGGFASSGVVKLWDNLDINGEGSVASFFAKCSPAVLLAAGSRGTDAVQVSAWDARVGFEMPALLAEWRQPGRLLGKIIGVEAGDVKKIYVGNGAGEEMTVGDMRMVNRMVTESDVETMVRRRRPH